MTAPTPGEREPYALLDTLCDTWHRREEAEYDHMRGACSTLAMTRADFAYREARRLVVAHIDALADQLATAQREAAGRPTIKQRVTQTRLHSESESGNCMAACFASVLGGDIADYDAILDPAIETGTWWYAAEKLFLSHGYGVIRISTDFGDYGGAPRGVCFASGLSPRGVRHMCVMDGGKIAHDPHPSRAGLTEITDYSILIPWSVPELPDITPAPEAGR